MVSGGGKGLARRLFAGFNCDMAMSRNGILLPEKSSRTGNDRMDVGNGTSSDFYGPSRSTLRWM